MEQSLKDRLAADEEVLSCHRLHGMMLTLPVFFAVMGLIQFSPWSFGPDTTLAGWVCLAYAAFAGLIFVPLYLHGRVALTNRRVIYLQKTPGRDATLEGWDAGAFDGVMIRKGILGGLLGYGHLILTRSGRRVAVIRGVCGAAELAPRIGESLLFRGARA